MNERLTAPYDGQHTGNIFRNRFLRLLGSQLANPRGVFGALIGRTIFTKGNAGVNTWVAKQLDLSSGSHVLEVGCGPGLAVQAIAARFSSSRVVGIERSPIMVRQARQRNAAAIQAGQVEIQEADATSLSYPDATFDAVVAIHVLYFWTDPVAALRELRRVLRPGGQVVLGFALEQDAPRSTREAFAQTGATFYPTAQAVIALLEAAGFSEICTKRQPDTIGIVGTCAFGTR
jgi:ubiquinone/menaquinone biosynthesis C-methylase UbiE